MQSSTRLGDVGIVTTRQGDAALVTVSGTVDEHFRGFGDLARLKTLAIDVSGIERMTSFGVRQWLKTMDELSRAIEDVYLLGCPTFFVDQLNMVLHFGGTAKVLTAMAPFACAACGAESCDAVDVFAERVALVKGQTADRACASCGGKLELDEVPASYFSFVARYAPLGLSPQIAKLLAEVGRYTAVELTADKPPRIVKLIHGSVTYFRIVGVIGSLFRARPFLVGAEGEVVIDLAEVERFDPTGSAEWQRMLKTLSAQVPAVTLVDVTESLLANAPESLRNVRKLYVASVLVPHRCGECGRSSSHSQTLQSAVWPLAPAPQVCPSCGGVARSLLAPKLAAILESVAMVAPTASMKVIGHRRELLSRALTDAKVAQAGDAATADLIAQDVVLGKYRIVRRLSAGGMAEVFLANQTGIGGFEKPVALKRIQRQLLESRHRAIDMFLNEAKIAGRLMHPNIVQVFDVGEVGGALYLAMEYVHGKDLREISKRLRATGQRMALAEACFVVREVAQALHYAYWSNDMDGKQMRVVHRDVSPHNIIMSYEGVVKLLDFGVASSSVTEQEESMIVGKWQYMSPEHTLNQPLDHRSDLFSLGVVLYLLLTGQMPFAGKKPQTIVAAIRAGEVKPVSELLPEIPPELAQLVARLLAVAPEARPQTGREVVEAIDEIARANNLDCSAPALAKFLSTMFEVEREEPAVLELVRRAAEEIDGAATKRIAIGSGATQAQSDFNDGSVQPVPARKHRLDTGSASINARMTPVTGVSEVSQSLVRRLSEEPEPDRGSNVVSVVSPRRIALRNLLLALFLVVTTAVVAYLCVSNL